MRSPARDVDPQTNLHLLLLPVEVLDGGGHDGGRGAPDIRYQRSPAADLDGGVIRFLTGPASSPAWAPSATTVNGKESTTAAPIAIPAVTDERRSPMNLRGRPDPTRSISTSPRMNVAAEEPRWPAALADQALRMLTVASASIRRSTVMARASRVCSSTMSSSFRIPPSRVRSPRLQARVCRNRPGGQLEDSGSRSKIGDVETDHNRTAQYPGLTIH
jgi:hypothetical protein